jgi:hypothetical protein
LEAEEECRSSCPCVVCVGDCSGDEAVTIDELIRGVSIALGLTAATECPNFDPDDDGQVVVSELIQGVNAALSGCP